MLIKKLNDCLKMIAGDKTILREIVNPLKDQVSFRYSLAQATVKPGQTTAPHKMKTSELYYILSGQGIMTINGETADIFEGDAVDIPPMATQYIKNTGGQDLVFLCIVDPAWRVEDEVIL